MEDLIKREDAIRALRCEYPTMPIFKGLREEWAIKTEGFRKAEEVIMNLPSTDRPQTSDLINGAEMLKRLHTDLCYGIACKDCSMCTEDGGCRVEEWIDTFPSADTDISEYSDKLWRNAYKRGKADRPQGEWIDCKEPPSTDRNVFIAYGTDDMKSVCIGHYEHDMKLWYEDKNFFAKPMYDAMYWCEIPQFPTRMKGADDE